ncbi:MAG: malonyl-CoA decarboxylase [Ectothiorhodospiraceae bacterium]|nr:malonyl-CoA decarboxylase [Ectothiorhodospiraceae bacterium]
MNGTFLNDLLSTLTQRYARRWLGRHDDSGQRAELLLEQCRVLLASDGEASSMAHAHRALQCYQRLDAGERLNFFRALAGGFNPDPDAVHRAYAAYSDQPDSARAQALFRACEPPRQELLRRLNLLPGYTFELVRMRADLQRLLPDHPELRPLDADFSSLFSSWFNRGFLVLRRIDWHTSASVLEKIIAYEAVHAMRGWDDLRRRLNPADRRCFAFFHPATGDEPLIFVQVALTDGLPDRIQPILDSQAAEPGAAEEADTAAFYSISNCQVGLRGISFGNFLIKQVVQELRQELPNLRHFVTLSPLPGFVDWLRQQRDDPAFPLGEADRNALAILDTPDPRSLLQAAEGLQSLLMPLAARYLLEAKGRKGQPANPVARFHLGNGARLHRLNWLGDISDNGLRQSLGLMVNYLYVLDEIEANHERFASQGEIVSSREVQRLAKQAEKRLKREPPATPA